MKTAVFAGSSQIRLDKTPLPEPAHGEVRVRLEGCGVCASNLPVWQGRPWFRYPLLPGNPGHEGWGRVDAVGPAAGQWQVGMRVALLSFHAFAEYDIAPASALVAIPPALDGLPFPGEPLGCAMNIFRRSGIDSTHTVAIVGIGFLGALLTRLASLRGARVLAISRRPFALEIARRMGAQYVIQSGEQSNVLRQVMEVTEGAGCERVIEAVGEQGPLDLASDLTREGGRLVIAGYHQEGRRQVNMQLWNWRGLDVVNAHERKQETYIQGMREALAAVQDGVLEPSSLYTHRFPLEELPAAFQCLQHRPDGFLKALITYG